MAMLGAHSQLAVPEVTWLYPRFRPFIHTYGTLEFPENFRTLLSEMLFSLKCPFFGHQVNPRTIVDEVLEFARERTFSGAFSAIMGWQAARVGKARWGEKTPHNLFFLREIFADFPDARVLIMTRDGRDVVSSQISSCFGPTHVVAGAVLWARCVQETLAAQSQWAAEQLMVVPYEMLAREPEATLKKIAGFVGAEWESGMLQFHQTELARHRAATVDHRSLGEPVHTRGIGIYREMLSLHEQRIFAAIAGKALSSMGYQSDVEPVAMDAHTVQTLLERDGRTRAALLDAPAGHICFESCSDWLADQRERRRLAGLWTGPPPPAPTFDDWPQEQILGYRAPAVFKKYFAIRRQYEQPDTVL